MLVFSAKDPFPLAPGENYASAKIHSAAVDEWLGLRVSEVEAKISAPCDGQERWQKQGAAVFLTPYTEFRAWLAELCPPAGSTIVDLGAGYGRLGFVLARHYPQCFFRGFELVPERVAEGSAAFTRWGALSAALIEADLTAKDFMPPPADIYFIYDFGSRQAIAKTLADLQVIARRRAIRVVGRGRSVRDQIEREHPWLGGVQAPLHTAHYSVYCSS